MTGPSVVVIGVGNDAGGDDAIGLEVVRAVETRSPTRPLRIVEVDGEPTRFLDAWDGAASAVVVDAARWVGGSRSVVMLDGLHDTVPDDERRSSHGLGLGAAIELGRRLGRLPDRLVVVAVRGERFTPGFGLSDTGRRHTAEAIGLVVELVGSIDSVALGLDRRHREVHVAAQPTGEIEPKPA